MFEQIKRTSQLLKNIISAFFRYPSLIAPLMLVWLIYAPTALYFKYYFEVEKYTLQAILGIVFLQILLFSILLSYSCFVVLDLVKGIETDGKPHLGKALFNAVPNLIRSLPIAVVWAFIWFLISVIKALHSRLKGDSNSSNTNNLADAAGTLGGFENRTLSGALLEALNKGVRMLAFLIYPSIAWEKGSLITNIKRGLWIAKIHAREFFSGFVLTEFLAVIVFLPPTLIYVLSEQGGMVFPDWIWIVTIIYIGFAWSFSILIEQLFVAELFIWNLHWENAVKLRAAKGEKAPSITQVRLPSLIDGVNDLNIPPITPRD